MQSEPHYHFPDPAKLSPTMVVGGGGAPTIPQFPKSWIQQDLRVLKPQSTYKKSVSFQQGS